MGRATNFENCYLYHIVDKENIVHYVGSTSNLNSRKSSHKYRCNHENSKEYHLDIYKYIRDHGGFENFEIIPVRKIENVKNKTDLLIAEQDEMNKFSNLKNKYGSYRSEEERVIQSIENSKKWNKDNPERKNQNNRNYYHANKEQICEKQRKRYHEKKELKVTDQ